MKLLGRGSSNRWKRRRTGECRRSRPIFIIDARWPGGGEALSLPAASVGPTCAPPLLTALWPSAPPLPSVRKVTRCLTADEGGGGPARGMREESGRFRVTNC